MTSCLKLYPFGYHHTKYKSKNILLPKRYAQRGFKYFLWQRMQKVKSKRIKRLYDNILTNYVKFRVILGKVDIPYFELVLTTKCSMRCESCNNMMQYFAPNNQYYADTQHMLHSLNTLFAKVDSICRVRIIGGEPLLFKDLRTITDLLESNPKVKSYDIVTNGTIDFKQDVLDSIKNSHKCMISISNYSNSPNLTLRLRHKTIVESLQKYNILYHFNWANKDDKWFNPGKIYKRNRTKDDIIKNFRSCMMKCVSLMSNDFLPKYSNKDAESSIAPSGAMFVCPIASSLSRLKGLSEFSGDFINIQKDSKDRILHFYAQDFYKACDYCHDMWAKKEFIPIAIQTKSVFSLKP